jgi:acetyl esterase/lipase
MIRSLALALACMALATPALAQTRTPAPAPAARGGGEVAMEELTLVWAKPGGTELSATVYRPRNAPRALPALIDVHGGAWGSGDRTGDALYCRELAKTGLVVVSIDFRQAPAFRHPTSSADIAAAVRFVRLNAQRLNADPAHVGLIGSSSGAHLALLEALRPEAAQHRGTPIADPSGAFAAHDDLSARVDYVIAMWPVSDPAARYRYAKRANLTRLAEMSLAYFPDEAAMWDASIPRIVTSGEAATLPPIMVVQPGDDSNIPQDMTFDLLHAWQARGGKVDYAFYPGQPHAFGHRASPATSDLIRSVAAFIQRRLAE